MQVNQDDRITPQHKKAGANGIAILAVALLALLLGGAYYYISTDSNEPQPTELEPVPLPATTPEEPLPTEAPVPEPEIVTTQAEMPPESQAQAPEPLPPLAESDDFVQQKVITLADGMAIAPLLIKQNLARQWVVFVDNLAQGELARKASPMKGPKQAFSVTDITNKTYLNPDGYHRYDMYADFVAGLDEQQLLQTYRELSPLFETAFDELGYGELSFEERMQQAFKTVLAAPVIEDPIELTSISVNYKFADPKLEALPSAQKLLIRMGPENTRKIKAAVRKLQAALE
ncbi:DUF3014 domain-containing protein [Shewanella salipaludis]|uniref:DUF3014 domain-containing protein n=1 Tax=Shewanella salipaludis TaxID=2723052 RepID=A0A972G2J1_9GAMM|nr:DUF3014 domain-containing protein [Shewanella salipaludis]NMH66316.1 DUF3014 domain-containing protein [Shewanella salipaludis]